MSVVFENPLTSSLKGLLRYIERDLENNSLSWKPHDIPEYANAVATLKGLGIEHKYVCESSIQDVVDDVVERGVEYGFQQDEDSVRGAIAESAALLNFKLSEDEIVLASDRILEKEREAFEVECESS